MDQYRFRAVVYRERHARSIEWRSQEHKVLITKKPLLFRNFIHSNKGNNMSRKLTQQWVISIFLCFSPMLFLAGFSNEFWMGLFNSAAYMHKAVFHLLTYIVKHIIQQFHAVNCDWPILTTTNLALSVLSTEFVIGLNDLHARFVLTANSFNTTFSLPKFPSKLISMLSTKF